MGKVFIVLCVIVGMMSSGIAGESIIQKKSALASYLNEYQKASGLKAFAQSKYGAWGWKSSHISVKFAIEEALAVCNKNASKENDPCEIINVEGYWVDDITLNCYDLNSRRDNLLCLTYELQLRSFEMNKLVNELTQFLTVENQNRFNMSQELWISLRNSSCSDDVDDRFYIDLECANRATLDRSLFIKSRIAECNQNNCDPNKF